MVFSRAFRIPRPWEYSGRNDGQQCGGNDGSGSNKNDLRYVLVPGVDLANYARRPTAFIRIHGKSASSAVIELVAAQKLEPFEEVSLSYGQHDSPCLHTLLRYGFCDDDGGAFDAPPSRARAAVTTMADEAAVLSLIKPDHDISGNDSLRRVLEDVLRDAARHADQEAACRPGLADGGHKKLDDRNRCEMAKTMNQERAVVRAVLTSWYNLTDY